MVGLNIMTVISDGIDSWTTQLFNDSTLDTSYGVGGSALIIKGNGSDVAEVVNGMVFDGSGNMLIFGSNALLGGYVKRLLINGQPDGSFGGYTGSASTALYPIGTTYGLLTSVQSVAQLSNGNIVVVGDNNGVGTIMMLDNSGMALTTFGSNGFVVNGMNITSVSVDSSDNIYVSIGYVDIDSITKVRIMKITSISRAGRMCVFFP